MRRLEAITIGIAALLVPAPGRADEGAWFRGLGDLEGGQAITYLSDLSTDGTFAVGTSHADNPLGLGFTAFRWDASQGMIGLYDGTYWGRAVSDDGTIVAGSRGDGGFRWTEDGENLVLPFGAADMTPDGTVIVGVQEVIGGTFIDETNAYRWDAAGGAVVLPDLDPDDGVAFSNAGFVSDDGAWVIGHASGHVARWDAAGTLEVIPSLDDLILIGVSRDGSILVLRPPAHLFEGEVVTWDASNGVQTLAATSFPLALSTVSVEAGFLGGGQRGSAAVLWDPVRGERDAAEVLAARGIDLAGWELTNVAFIRRDGRIIAGSGVNPAGDNEAWIADLPEPTGAAGAVAVSFAFAALGRRRGGRRPRGRLPGSASTV